MRGKPVVRDSVFARIRDGIDAWVDLVAGRMPTYVALAAATWDTSSRPIDHIAAEIAEWVRDRAHSAGGS